MRTRVAGALLFVAAFAAIAASCGSDDDASEASVGDAITIASSSSTTTTAPSATQPEAAGTTVPYVDDTSDIPVQTVTDGTNDIVVYTTPDTTDVPVVVSVTVGIDDAEDRVENVPFGATVTLMVTNPDADDEFHLHGYELGDGIEMPAGQTETFTFTADQAGQFELESHVTDSVLVILDVG